MNAMKDVWFWITLLVVGLCAIAISRCSYAAELTPQQAVEILAVAYGQYHGPRELFEDGTPPIHIVTQAELQQRARCSSETCPTIRGLYDDEHGEIYLEDTLDFSTVYATTVLLHEYIHYFQGRTRGRLPDLKPKLSKYDYCMEKVEREVEAYRIQYQVLLKAGDFQHARQARMAAGQMRCFPTQ